MVPMPEATRAAMCWNHQCMRSWGGRIQIERIDARHAKARTSMQEWGRFEDGSSMRVAGTYFNELVNTGDGRWRFTHRRFVAHYADTEPVPGTVFPVGR
ncbi:hypothetical protein D7Y04_11750 [Corallococcus sp. AB038B]|nr:hypothetical protein D7Y04_11750 [Corallococcus sp. AB038B]